MLRGVDVSFYAPAAKHLIAMRHTRASVSNLERATLLLEQVGNEAVRIHGV